MVFIACGGGDGASGQTAEPTDVAKMLFAAEPERLGPDDQNTIAAALYATVSEDGASLLDELCGQPLGYAVTFRDLNGDGEDEVILDHGNTCTVGTTGTRVTVFVRGADGAFAAHLGIPGMIAEIRDSPDGGFAQLLLGGPGFCFGLWGWDGETYAHVRNEPQEPGGCDGRG